MDLTTEDTEILSGKHGEGAALAMKILVGIGEAFDARRLVSITRAHVALSNQEGDLWFAEKLAGLGAKCRVPPTVNPGYNDSYFGLMGLTTPDDDAFMQRTFRAYQTLGAILNFSCTPYLFDKMSGFPPGTGLVLGPLSF